MKKDPELNIIKNANFYVALFNAVPRREEFRNLKYYS